MLTCSIIISLENVSYIVYHTSHLDIVSYPLVTMCGIIVSLFDSSVFFSFFVDGVPMFVFATRVH